MTDVTRRAAVAERAARAGGVVARDQFRTDVTVETKADRTDVVTAADRQAQEQILTSIRGDFSSQVFVCEEDVRPRGTDSDELAVASAVPDSGDAWVVDPIDGTANFTRGIRFWATSVAAVVDGTLVAAATYLPAEEDIYTAGPESVTWNGSAMSVSDRTDLDTFAIALVGRYGTDESDRYASVFRTAGARFGDTRRFGSVQGALALVAAGSLEAAVVPTTPHPWDAVAGSHLVCRAGGKVTDVSGESWRDGAEALVASNGERHDAVLDGLREGLGVEAPTE